MSELEPQDTKFSTITANVDDETAEKICRMYVERMMHPATVSLFDQLLDEGADIQYALYRAVINQSIIASLLEDLDKPGHPIPPFDI